MLGSSARTLLEGINGVMEFQHSQLGPVGRDGVSGVGIRGFTAVRTRRTCKDILFLLG